MTLAMSIFAWYDIPVALFGVGLVVLACQSWQRDKRNRARGDALFFRRSERRVEDFYWAVYRVYEAAEAELIYVNRVIESYVNGTAEIERPRELHSVRVTNLEEVV